MCRLSFCSKIHDFSCPIFKRIFFWSPRDGYAVDLVIKHNLLCQFLDYLISNNYLVQELLSTINIFLQTFSRSQVGRGGSFRMPKKPEVSNSSRNRTLSGQTWSGRKSGERSRITEDTFSYSTNTSPKHRAPRATSASPHPQRRTTKSVPTTPTGGNFKSPILRDLNNIDLEDDQIILKKMEEIINAYKLITERNSTPSEKLSRTCDGRPPVPRSRADSISKSRARSSSVSQSETLPRCSSSRGNSPKLAQPSCKENQNSPRPRRHSIQDEATPLFRRESGLTPSKIPIPVFRLE